MRYVRLAVLGLVALAALLAGADVGSPASADPAAVDSDGDGIPDASDACPLVAEDPDGVADGDGCPDTDASVSAATDTAYTVPVSTVVTKRADIWFGNGNYSADMVAHALTVSTVGACEVSLIPAAGDRFMPFSTDEDGDTVLDTFFFMLEWEFHLDAGQALHTSRDYEVHCLSPGQHSFEIQVDVAPLPPVREEDVEKLSNVHKTFPVVTATGSAGNDSDGDGFSDDAELYLATDPQDACPDIEGVDDAWPLDNTIDRSANVVDVLFYKGKVPSDASTPELQRLDLDGSGITNAVGAVNVVDVLVYKGAIPSICT